MNGGQVASGDSLLFAATAGDLNLGAPVLTAAEGRQVLRFALAAEQSAREGRTIRLAG